MMLTFWIISALLLVLPVLVILLTLLKNNIRPDLTTEKTSDIYQQQLNEIDSDIENGLLSPPDADSVKQELQLTLLNQTKNINTHKIAPGSSSSTFSMAFLLVFIPAFVVGVYFYLGQPGIITQSALLADFNNAETDEEKMVSVEKMLLQLERRLLDNPDDVDGWLMLANSYTALDRHTEALKAFDNLLRLRSNDPTVILRYADVLSLVNGGVYTGKPTELIHKALKIDPENPSGLWLAGLAANESGDIDNAVLYWKKLLPKLEDGSEPQKKIKQYIELAESHISNTDTDKAEIAIIETALTINVSLSDELIEEVNDDDIVFVYAKAITGAPMPLAIVRKQVKDLPFEVILNDELAMIPTHKLSDHKHVQLTARISKTGNAIPQQGDFIGSVEKVETSSKAIFQITIKDIIL